MATYNVTAQTRRVQFTGDGTAGPFAFSFQVNATSEIKVYVDSTVKTESSHYTVSLNSGTGAGTVSFTSGNHPTSSQTITILGSIPLSRTSVYTSGGQLTSASLESDFDTNMFVHQQTNEEIDRSLRLAEHDVISGADMTLPVKDTRKGTVLGFNATTGNPEAGPSITSVQSLADVTTAINLLGTSAVVEDLGILGTTAIVEDMGLLATSANVSAMALLGTSAVVADMALLGTSDVVADMALLATTDVIADMNTLATSDIITDLNTLATSDIVTDMNLLATSANVTAMGILGTSANVNAMGLLGTSAVVTDLNLLATSAVIEDMGLLATSAVIEDMGLLATSAVIEDMGLLATSAVIEDMGLLATSVVIEDMGLLATSANITNMATLGASGVVGNIATVATGISGVNAFAERYRVGSSDPSSSNDEGDLFYNTSDNTFKFFNGSSYVAVNVSGIDNLVEDTTPQLGGNLDGQDKNITTTGVGTFASLDISGDIDVDGTTNLDVVDIDGAVDMASTLNVSGVLTANAGIKVDDITIDGSEIDLSGSGNFTVDVGGNIILDSNGGIVNFKDDGTSYGRFKNNSNTFEIKSQVSDGDIKLMGNDGGVEVTALRLDMSDAGTAHFNYRAVFNSNVGIGTSLFPSKFTVSHAGTDNVIETANTTNSVRGGMQADTSIVGMGAITNHTLVFRQNNTERMRIDSSGNVFIGTTALPSGGGGFVGFEIASKGRAIFQCGTTDTTAETLQRYYNPNGSVGSITVSGSATAFNTSSDYRLKDNLNYSFDATSRLKQLKPARFNFIADADTTVDGFLAHEVQSVVPEAITGTHNEVDADGNPVYQGIDQSKLVPLLVKTIQELEARITTLEGA